MEFLILAILIGVFAIISSYLVPFASAHKKNSLCLAVIMATLLIPITLFLLNQQNLVLQQQNEVIQWVSGKWESTATKEKRYEWARKNFLFIDISYAHKLIEKPGGNQLGHSTTSITDRHSLARFLQQLGESDSLVDLVICDMYFDAETSDDSLLREALTDNSIHSKLVTGYNHLRPNTSFFGSLGDSVYGNIVERANNHQFATHSIFTDGRPSLSYLAYTKMAALETQPLLGNLIIHEGPSSSYALNTFIPQFDLTDEKALYLDELPGQEQSTSIEKFNYYEIGDIVSNPAGGLILSELLRQRKIKGYQNIIFIGAFKSEDLDVHDTYFGRLHGPTIHLNLLYAFINGQHRLNIWYILYLWIFTAFIFYLVIRKSLTEKAKTKEKRNHFRSALHAAWYLLVIDELHFWLFAAFVFSTALICGRMINGLVLFFILLLCYKVFKYHKES